MNVYIIEPATAADAVAIRAPIRGAYAKYVPRIGREPAPMQADALSLIASGGISVLRFGQSVIGSVRLSEENDALEINELVVKPTAHGRGLGRMLMDYAEQMARSRELRALTLYTNEKMVENIAIYQRLGFAEIDRKSEDGFDRIYFRKEVI